MNIVYYLLEKFFYEEKWKIISLIILSLVTVLVQTNLISLITANIINAIEHKDFSKTIQNYQYFFLVSALFMTIYYVYKYLQNITVNKMMQWIKHEIFKVILLVNNEDMCHVNFVEFITPITRISVSCYILFYDILSMIMPTMAFLLMISGFFIYKSPIFGLMFLVGNILVGLYATYFWNDMTDYKNDQETWINDNEKYLVDILNNIDKVIYRGQVQSEIDAFSQKTDDSIAFANGYYGYVQNHTTIMSGMIYIIIFASIYYLIVLRFQDKITTTIFISFFTVLLLYRDKILGTINNIPDYLEFVGRLGYIVGTFNTMLGQKENVAGYLDKKYDEIATPFDRIQFRDVSFKYDKTEKMILDHFNIDLEFKDKIIGITGLSGKGKSSFVKLMLRLYEPTSGEILLDGIPLKTIDPSFIRKNITYVNQNAKLFDKKVIDNILYGCNELGECREHLDKILKDAKIQELFRNVDVENTKAGSLGENLSGGQRQIINMIGGFINPSEILILDEPTNALDGDLKKQVLQFIQYFKRYKKCVIIITHDRDVFPLFDENVQI